MNPSNPLNASQAAIAGTLSFSPAAIFFILYQSNRAERH